MLQFTAFNIQSHSSCAPDYLTITDGDGETLLERSCGSTLPTNITSTSNMVDILFKTNAHTSKIGWSISWNALTPGVLYQLNCKILNISFSCIKRFLDRLIRCFEYNKKQTKCLLRILLSFFSPPAHCWPTLHCLWSPGLPLSQ